MESSFWFAQLLAADSVANWPGGVSSFMSVQAILHDADAGRSASAAVLRSHGAIPYFDWPTDQNDSFCASPPTRAEVTVSIQIGGYLEPSRKSTADQVVCGVYMSSQSLLHEDTNL